VEGERDDSLCVKRVLNGEHRAYNELFHRYQSRVFSMVLMMTKDRSGAEEVTQDAFLRAYSNLTKYDQGRPFYPWLATIAARLGINWINRTGTNQKSREPEFDSAELPARDPSPADDLESQQVEHTLWDQVAKLPQGERTAVLMFYKQELTVGEIAGILGVTKGTIKTFLHRGRAHLRTRLGTAGEVE